MKLTLNLHSLMRAIEIMEPEKKGVFVWDHQITEKSKIDIELAQGKDVELKDVDIDSGLLSYQGRQV
ncbi:HNH endonuclease, partial [Vibrio parahaemolyticus]